MAKTLSSKKSSARKPAPAAKNAKSAPKRGDKSANASKAKPAKGGVAVKAAPAKAVAKSRAAGKDSLPVGSAGKATAGKVNGHERHAPKLKGKAAAAHVLPRNGTAGSLPDLLPRPMPEAVPTDGKPRKNQAGISPKELEHFRDLLLTKRRELVGDMVSMESEALRTSGGTNLSNLPLHMADMGTDNYEQEFTLGLVEKDRALLREINSALAKIQNGTYGICEGTGKAISKVRLEAQPWARFSIEHARSLERRIR